MAYNVENSNYPNAEMHYNKLKPPDIANAQMSPCNHHQDQFPALTQTSPPALSYTSQPYMANSHRTAHNPNISEISSALPANQERTVRNQPNSSVIRNKQDKHSKGGQPYTIPGSNSLTHRSQKSNPLTIVIQPRNQAQNNQHTAPRTPTKVARTSTEDVTPTAQRIHQAAPEQQGRMSPPTFSLYQQAQHEDQEHQMDEYDNVSEVLSQADYNPFEDSTPPTRATPSQDLLDHQMPTENERLKNDLLSALQHAEEIVIKLTQNGCLAAITKDEDITLALQKLSASIPSMPAVTQLEPLLSGIGILCQKVNTLTETLEHQNKKAPDAHSLQDSIHAPSARNPTGKTHKQASFSSVVQGGKTLHQQQPATTTNPRLAHHHSRLVVQILPDGAPANNRLDPSDIVSKVNAALSTSQESSHIKVVAASYNKQGNIILSTRADQTAAELAKHENILRPVLSRISGAPNVEIRQDKKWFKVQIDGVNTGTLTIGQGRAIYTGEKIHDELQLCNPLYAQLTKHIVAKPRWLRTNEEIQTIPRSSLVVAFDDEQAAKAIINLKALAVFGRHCTMRAFQERPPVTQCRKCWRFDHTTERCTGGTCCRICGGSHTETDHPIANPATCNKCILARELGDMDTTSEGQCPHQFKCTNCVVDFEKDHEHPADSRRCPTRLEKYGSARDNDRRASRGDNPWVKAKPKKSGPKKKNNPPPPQPTPGQIPSQNRYETLQDHANSSTPQLPEHIAQLAADLPHAQPWI